MGDICLIILLYLVSGIVSIYYMIHNNNEVTPASLFVVFCPILNSVYALFNITPDIIKILFNSGIFK